MMLVYMYRGHSVELALAKCQAFWRCLPCNLLIHQIQFDFYPTVLLLADCKKQAMHDMFLIFDLEADLFAAVKHVSKICTLVSHSSKHNLYKQT